MIDFGDLLFGPIHDAFGDDGAVLTVDGTDYPISVIDKSAGIEVVDVNTGNPTLRPAAEIGASDLAAHGLTKSQLPGAAIAFTNGETYRIESTMPKPTPKGEADGAILLWLSE